MAKPQDTAPGGPDEATSSPPVDRAAAAGDPSSWVGGRARGFAQNAARLLGLGAAAPSSAPA